MTLYYNLSSEQSSCDVIISSANLGTSLADCRRLHWQKTTVVPVVPVVSVEKVYVLYSIIVVYCRNVVYYSLLIVFSYPTKMVQYYQEIYRSL